MNRRAFMQGGIAALALSAADLPPKRVGLIGCGWYGKSDIFRLVQVAPVEIVSLCDVDRQMMAECAEMVAQVCLPPADVVQRRGLSRPVARGPVVLQAQVGVFQGEFGVALSPRHP